ncbi:MAG TPA: thiolase family protein [Bryobacteraceae bacterium]|nr:thiolase family protein [Bryobacteraceae bacterium]
MARDVFVIGAFSTEFRKWPGKSFKQLSAEAFHGALADTGLSTSLPVDSIWFANSGMGAWGQTSIRGQVALGSLTAHTPIINVENACAGGGTAICGAWKDILTGEAELSLAIGVEKLHFPDVDKGRVLEGMSAGIDNFDTEEWFKLYRTLDETFHPKPGRSVFVDTSAARARRHMREFGTTAEQIAAVCAKSHWYGARNPRAQYQFEIPAPVVLKDQVVNAPLTRAMCASPGDGAAAALLCSGEFLRALPEATQRRAVRVEACALAGGSPTATIAAEKAYRRAGIGPGQIDVAELHDSTSFCQIEQLEALGFCNLGEGASFDGVPVNTSGGLVSKSHPVAATGISMLHELVEQLRGEAGSRQVDGAKNGLLYNAGGAIGLDDAVGCVVIVSRQIVASRFVRVSALEKEARTA